MAADVSKVCCVVVFYPWSNYVLDLVGIGSQCCMFPNELVWVYVGEGRAMKGKVSGSLSMV